MTTITRWTGDADDYLWSDAANWTAGPPRAGIDATVGAAANAFISLAVKKGASADAVGSLSVTGGSLEFGAGALDFLPKINASAPTYDLLLDKKASLTVLANARFVGRQTMVLGQDGSATLMTVYGQVAENYAMVQGGTLAVTEGGHWISGASGLEVGGQGQGTLIVSNGGAVDEGAAGLTLPAAQLDLGDGFGKGTAVIEGQGSYLALTEIYLGGFYAGGGYSGTMSILNGGEVVDQLAVIAAVGDGYVTVSGKGSRWINRDHLAFGNAVPTDSSLTVTDFGDVEWGAGGFFLLDTLNLDGSATLKGRQIYDGGQVVAEAGHGDVTLSQNIGFATNWLFQFQELGAFSSTGGVELKLTGHISGDGASILYVGAGHVAVERANNAYGLTEIYSATLEDGANGALGAGAVDFTGGANAATLLIDKGVKFANAISGFVAADTIDLAGLKYVSGVKDAWTANKTGPGGTLTITSGTATATLHFADTFTAGQFTFSSDAGGGTLVKV